MLIKKIIDQYSLRYDANLKMGEDCLFNQIFLLKCNRIRRTQENEYYYNNDNLDSVSHKYYPNRLEQQIHLLERLEEEFQDKDICRLRWDFWHEVINHYNVKGISNENANVRKHAISEIKKAYISIEFKKCVPYIRQNGSLDEKLETYFMNYYLHWLYKPLLWLIQKIYLIKNLILK